ncbi:(2Fe-2S)-binding protein [Streptomyces sp. NPDC005728]|uniref:(2Fe-2S)-binding protein n=1 Tax=Streptomyces sp. NPDC005728 TaxID=3157054 RepID=UPI0034107E94
MNPLELAGARPGAAFTVTFDGRPVGALPGQTVAAALWAAGVTSWRSTREAGRPRGVFCGIGVCFDCLVTVNGRPNQRACLVPVRPGDVIRTQEGTGRDDD